MPLARGHMSRDLLSVEPGLPLTEVAQRMVANLEAAMKLSEEIAEEARDDEEDSPKD